MKWTPPVRRLSAPIGSATRPAATIGGEPDHRHRGGAGDLDRPGHQRLVVLGVAGEDAGGVAADAEEGGVAEGDEAAVAEREVEADAGHAEDRGLGGERDDEGLAGERGRRAARRRGRRGWRG